MVQYDYHDPDPVAPEHIAYENNRPRNQFDIEKSGPVGELVF
jgi:hypothetical protein